MPDIEKKEEENSKNENLKSEDMNENDSQEQTIEQHNPKHKAYNFKSKTWKYIIILTCTTPGIEHFIYHSIFILSFKILFYLTPSIKINLVNFLNRPYVYEKVYACNPCLPCIYCKLFFANCGFYLFRNEIEWCMAKI